MTRGQWVYAGARGSGGKLSVAEKLAITAECENLIASILMPRFLPEIRPTEFNYPIAIYGKWHGNKYRGLQEVVWVFWATSEGWKHACEHLEPQIFLVA